MPILIRLVILSALIGVVVLLFSKSDILQYDTTMWRDSFLQAAVKFYVTNNVGLMGLHGPAGMLVPYAATCMLILFTFTNREYLYWSPAAMTVVMAALVFEAGYWTAYMKVTEDIKLVIAAIIAVPALRIILDFSKIIGHMWRYSRIDPISAELGNAFGEDLAAMVDTTVQHYPSIHEAELIRRLERGALNVSKQALNLRCPVSRRSAAPSGTSSSGVVGSLVAGRSSSFRGCRWILQPSGRSS